MAQTDIIMPTEAVRELPRIRTIAISDLRSALAMGLDDFKAMPTHALFLVAIYPIAGLLLAGAIFNYDVIPLLYPLITGFALLGPFAAIGLYELSRRREAGLDTSWRHAFDVVHSPSFGSMLAVGFLLLAIFAEWMMVAQMIYASQFDTSQATEFDSLLRNLVYTPGGRNIIIYGNLIGLLFAIAAFSISVVSFPLMLDRHVGYGSAITTSLMVVAHNPLTMAAWGVIVAALLFIGSLPGLVGLAIVLPVLGHATWHLYRKVLAPDHRSRPDYVAEPKGKRYAADFPASLFTRSTTPAAAPEIPADRPARTNSH